MSVLIDTSVWSLGLRRRFRDRNSAEQKVYFAWQGLLVKGEAALIGPIRQEALSGVILKKEFGELKEQLAVIEDLSMSPDTFIRAAEFYNICRAAGVAPGAVDMMICAAADAHGVEIFTTDPDFVLYARHLPIRLFKY